MQLLTERPKLPEERAGKIIRVKFQGASIFLNVGFFPGTSRPGEVFMTLDKNASPELTMVAPFLEQWCIALSVALQWTNSIQNEEAYLGAVLHQLRKHQGTRFDPCGFTIAGPQGGGSLNGAQMKAEGLAMMEKSIEDLKNYVDGSQPLTWVIG